MSERSFVCGTRAVIEKHPYEWHVVCATCGAGGTVKHETQASANKACVRDSNKPCQSCGAA